MVWHESRTGGKSALARRQEQSLPYLIQLRRSWRPHGFTEANSNWSVCLPILSSSISSGELLWMDQLSRTLRICRLVKCGSLFLLCKKIKKNASSQHAFSWIFTSSVYILYLRIVVKFSVDKERVLAVTCIWLSRRDSPAAFQDLPYNVSIV